MDESPRGFRTVAHTHVNFQHTSDSSDDMSRIQQQNNQLHLSRTDIEIRTSAHLLPGCENKQNLKVF